MYGMVCIDCKVHMGMESDPDSESKIWRLTGFGAGSGVLVSGFGVNFSDSAQL